MTAAAEMREHLDEVIRGLREAFAGAERARAMFAKCRRLMNQAGRQPVTRSARRAADLDVV